MEHIQQTPQTETNAAPVAATEVERVELPSYDVTREETQCALDESGTMRSDGHTMASRFQEKLLCRERQLLSALRELEQVKQERDEARNANERDRTMVFNTLKALDKEIAGRDWLRDSRGSYEWDDYKWHQEFGDAADAIMSAIKPLRSIWRDMTNCSPTLEEAGVIRTLVKRAELAESQGAEEIGRSEQSTC